MKFMEYVRLFFGGILPLIILFGMPIWVSWMTPTPRKKDEKSS